VGLCEYNNPNVQKIQMWERACSRKWCVRSRRCRLTLRFREQARSHRADVHMIFEGHHEM
jgi:hypothetical protein